MKKFDCISSLADFSPAGLLGGEVSSRYLSFGLKERYVKQKTPYETDSKII
jgi:hypothetical protein